MILNAIKSLSWVQNCKIGQRFLNDPCYVDAQEKTAAERKKHPKRTDVINFLLSTRQGSTCYLEIGVRNPHSNFNHIQATEKYSVDPGVEFKENPVDFQMTSNEFFSALQRGQVLSPSVRFDVVFIDGLHLADQVNQDVEHALSFLKDDGFVVLHDCNPPTEWHARENFYYHHTPAGDVWNGTVWKAFMKWRSNPTVQSCCVNSDWGVGVISKKHRLGDCIENTNPFFEYKNFETNRQMHLNLIEFDQFKILI